MTYHERLAARRLELLILAELMGSELARAKGDAAAAVNHSCAADGLLAERASAVEAADLRGEYYWAEIEDMNAIRMWEAEKKLRPPSLNV